MKPRTLIIGIGALILVILMTVAIFSAVGDRKLTLTSEPNIDKVSINGASTAFKQGMKIDYKESTTIEVAQNGYDAFKVTLDPTKDTANEYAIKLTKTSNAPVGSKSYDLFKAAENTDDGSGIIVDNKLNVVIKDTREFSGNHVLYTVAPIDGNGDTALVITKKQGNNYLILLGPGTNFDQNDLFGLPDDLVTYLKSIGIGSTE